LSVAHHAVYRIARHLLKFPERTKRPPASAPPQVDPTQHSRGTFRAPSINAPETPTNFPFPTAPLPAQCLKVFQYFRRFDASSDPNEFLDRYNADIGVYGFDCQFRLENFDRFLDGLAKNWLNPVWPKFKSEMSRYNCDFEILWIDL
jgi:hypothetical protein